ncbi:MAG: hypothetical protein E5Y12_29665 [Mesorhizobium sp.]|nr:MAG: hypothetical protein E5Y12_29665 [Mesorhizobium sp.]
MASTIKTVASVLAGSAMVLVLSMPANAAGLGVGASVGGNGGVNAGVGASVGGSSGVNAGLGASVGGSSGVSAGLGASIGGSNGVAAGLGANVDGTSGIGAGVGVGIGGGTNPSNPSNPSNRLNLSRTSLPGVVAQMSDPQVMRMKKRCVDVLGSEGAYDRDLRQLCLLIARR